MSGIVKLFYEISPGQNRLGFFDKNDSVLEVWFDAVHSPNLIGMVYQARINRVFLSQNRATASLIDGEIVSLRLHRRDMDFVISGTVLPVTITAAPRHGKPWQGVIGARLANKEMVLLVDLPDSSGVVQLSSQIDGDQRKNLLARLKAEVEPVLPSGFGIILRRGGSNLSDFGTMATVLVETWQAGKKTLDAGHLGTIFDAGDLLARARRLASNVTVINDPSIGTEMSAILDETINSACVPKLRLACGGHLWFEQTHAIWSIDLDSNLATGVDRLYDEAAIEIAKQIRLRAMSGPVLVDVPRCSSRRANRFRINLQKALGDDPRQPEYLGITRGGLIELRVPHGQMALGTVMRDQPAQASLAGLRLVERHRGFDEVTLAVSPAMAEWLNGPGRQALGQLDRPLKLVVCLESDEHQEAYIIGKNENHDF
ncbi:ribonuclease E/G [Candidatus Puniceispirillum sp.]|nr:ribonuclease E/G [Candidatus Puniceispirillum sp.]